MGEGGAVCGHVVGCLKGVQAMLRPVDRMGPVSLARGGTVWDMGEGDESRCPGGQLDVLGTAWLYEARGGRDGVGFRLSGGGRVKAYHILGALPIQEVAVVEEGDMYLAEEGRHCMR
jgi:hypothetical protein